LPIIIWGTKGITYATEEGQFHCPNCRSSTQYSQKRVRRFFTLYWIPLIPLDVVGEYVECTRCQGTYKAEVLAYDPEKEQKAFEAEFHRAVRRVMVLMMMADGEIATDELTTIRRLYQQLTDRVLEDDDLQNEVKAVEQSGAGAQEALGEIAGTLNDSGKEMVIRAAFLVAASDGEFADEEKQLLSEIAGVLQLQEGQLGRIIDEMLEPADG
jgi:tellurite resistance protein